MDARSTLQEYRERWGSFAASPSGRLATRVTRTLFLVLIVGYLVWMLTSVGWEEIWQSLPTAPLFYVLFLGLYFLLPAAETVMYRLSWSFDALRAFPAFVKKRIYNKDVLGYSGEVYFFSWARTNVGASERVLLETIRDNNVLSSLASTLIAIALLIVFLFVGELRLSALVGENWGYYVAGALVVLAALTPLAIRFRHFLFSMPVRIAAMVFGLQCARLILGQALQIGQWAVVMPEVPLRIWFTFAAVSILLTRIPFLPNQNLIFMGAGLELSGMMNISTAGVAGMLLVTNVLDKLLNAGLFGVISFIDRRISAEVPEKSAEPPRIDGS